jgi:choline dehydrogenase-like flavoprotein
MFTADSGQGGLGLPGRRMPVPRGRMLGGSSGINFMVYARGHPADFDTWAERGASGWSYTDVLPYFRKSEDFRPSNEISVDLDAHGVGGPLSVSVRSPVIPASRAFVEAAGAIGIPRGDYNGRDRGGRAGVASLVQANTRKGARSSTYHAFLEGNVEQRPNLAIITDARATRILMQEEAGRVIATGIEYRTVDGEICTAHASREIILCAGAVGSPHLLMLSGIGPRQELEAAHVTCLHDLPAVGKHLKDHVQCALFFHAPGIGLPFSELSISAGPDELRAPRGPLPADPADDAHLPPDLAALKAEAERRFKAWVETGSGLVSSSLNDAIAFYSTGLGETRSHDAQIRFIPCGLSPDKEGIILLANPMLPRSEGELVLQSNDPSAPPEIRMNYFADPHDLKVMVAVMRRALDIVASWPGPNKPGPLDVPPELAEKHGHSPGAPPSNALLEDMALHCATTVYHLSCTCRIGEVVDPRLRVFGVTNLRVADASVMPETLSGATNAASIMIGEKAAEMIARDHGVELKQFVGGN